MHKIWKKCGDTVGHVMKFTVNLKDIKNIDKKVKFYSTFTLLVMLYIFIIL